MSKHTISCDPKMLSRYYDGELDPEASGRLKKHMMECSACREEFEALKGVSEQIKAHVSEIPDAGPPMDSVEDSAINRIRGLSISPWEKLREVLLSKRTIIPAAVVASLVVVLFSVLQPRMPAGPSAIVTSLSGDMASVIIMEAPDTGHTILWFTEASGS